MAILRWLFPICLLASPAPTIDLDLAFATEPAGADADDPAVWVDRGNPAGSLILGTNKAAAPDGALVVYGLDGKLRQRLAGIDRPNNVDVEGDLAALTERFQRRVRLFRIRNGIVKASGSFPVFEGQQGEMAAPMGIALYRRPRDGALFAIVGRKTGPAQGYLWQYRLDGNKAVKVREFGAFSGGDSEIEAIAVDDELGFVYYADESCCIRKWHADPDHREADREVAAFGREGFSGNREGIAVWAQSGGEGYIVCTDQLPAASRYFVFRRRGDQGAPVAVLRGAADSTDGLEAAPALNLLIAMNSVGRNFLAFRWPRALSAR
jgi:3-phytase